jgi:hypothetical protein
MKRRLFLRVWLFRLGLLAVSGMLASCNSTQPRRDEASPMAPQWQSLRRVMR